MNPKKQRVKDRRCARKLADEAWEAANAENLDLAEKIIRRAVAAPAAVALQTQAVRYAPQKADYLERLYAYQTAAGQLSAQSVTPPAAASLRSRPARGSCLASHSMSIADGRAAVRGVSCGVFPNMDCLQPGEPQSSSAIAETP
jgi:hypothetical protein